MVGAQLVTLRCQLVLACLYQQQTHRLGGQLFLPLGDLLLLLPDPQLMGGEGVALPRVLIAFAGTEPTLHQPGLQRTSRLLHPTGQGQFHPLQRLGPIA